MAVRTHTVQSWFPSSPLIASHLAPRWYEIFGLRARSDFWLPAAESSDECELAADVVFSRAPEGQRIPEPDGAVVASVSCPVHGEEVVVRRGPGGAWIWARALGTCHILPTARRVDVYPAPGADERALGFVLIGRVSNLILHQFGSPSVHASAVVTAEGALGFLGRGGQGKSTMAAAFLARGGALLTDDALPLRERPDGVYGIPSMPFMKLWQATVDGTLKYPHELPDLWQDSVKKLVTLDGRFRFAVTPARLRAFYLLDRYEPATVGHPKVEIERLNGRDGLAALLGQISYGTDLLPSEMGQWFPFYARLVARTPVYRLSYPSGFEYQEDVCARVLESLAGTNGDLR
jgi:hypothetical protein